MDRYEYKVKLDEMKSYLAEGKIEQAVEVADSVNWKKVKMVSALCLGGEIYEKAERYDDSKELLLTAYERSPIGRTIIYRLALVAVKSGNIKEAEDFYNEFVEIAPTDNMRYILKYQIGRIKGSSVEELIEILEEYKDRESSERWAYELAALYHKAGKAEQCVDLCDELILWYGEGKFVEKALELKMLYQPLTKEQEKKFRKMKQNRTGLVEVSPEEELRSGEILSEKRVIPEVQLPPPTFNTVNLQTELAENIKVIREATDQSIIDNSFKSIKELANTIPYLKLPEENEYEDDEKYGHIQTQEEIDGSLKIDFQEMLGEEYGGQMSLQMPDQPTFEQQITGQMSIDEVLREWEKTKQAAEAAMEVAEQKRLEASKARALREAEGIMNRLNDVIPQLEAGKTPLQLMEEEYTRKMEEDAVNGIEFDLAPSAVEVGNETPVELHEEEVSEDSEPEEISELEDVNVPEEAEVHEETEAVEEAEIAKEAEAVEENETAKEAEAVEEPEEPKKHRIINFLTEQQKDYFAYFLKVDGMEKQICAAMDSIVHREEMNRSVKDNIIIEGGRGSGKTVLALNLVKALRKENISVAGSVGKISAEALNNKNVLETVTKMYGGVLIVEKAGMMTKETAESLSLAMEGGTNGMLVILEDTSAGIKKALALSLALAGKFGMKISVPIFTIDELVHFAKSYAAEHGYEIDEIAVLALYNRISNIQKVDRATYIAEVKEIMDEAMDQASKGGIKKAFTKRKTADGKTIIREKDFE